MFPTMNSRVAGIKRGTNHELITGMPLVVNGQIAIVPEKELEKISMKDNEIKVTAYFIKPSSFGFLHKDKSEGVENAK